MANERLRDLANQGHRERQIMEDYDFLISTGVVHENALKRMGVSAHQWDKIMNNQQTRAARARRKESA